MGQRAPLSPAPSSDEVVRTGRMTGHSKHTAYPDEISLNLSQGESMYHTPLTEDDFAALNHSHAYSTPNQESQLVNWESDGHSRGTRYPSLPAELQQTTLARPPFTPEETPPLSSTISGDIATRSGRALRRRAAPPKSSTLGGARVQKTPKKKKVQDASTILPKPLSEIAGDFPDIVVADVAAFATRSTEERHGSSTADGKIKRPLNAFMLYRKAYQKVAMAYCGSSSHQTVSLACGASWRCLEPDHIRKKFKDLADTETRKHKEAHPTYKYVPKKSGPDADMETIPSWDIDDDCEGRHGASRRGARGRRVESSTLASESPPVFHEWQMQRMDTGPPRPGMQHEASSSWSLPAQQHLQAPYYTPVPLSYVDPLMYPQPDAALWANHMADGLVRADHSWTDQEAPPSQGCVDPRLFETAAHPFNGLRREPSVRLDYGNIFPVLDGGQDMAGMMLDLDEHGAHNAYLRGSSSDWKVEPLEDVGLSDHFYEASYSEDWVMRGENMQCEK